MKEVMAAARGSPSVARRIDDGCTVATVGIPNDDFSTSPRCLLTRKAGPITDCAAVAPRRTSILLDGVRDVDPPPVDARLVERPLQETPRRPDKGLALQVLLVPGLLADEHHPGVLSALPEHGLGRLCPQVATFAGSGRILQLLHAPRLVGRLCCHAYRTHEFASNWA